MQIQKNILLKDYTTFKLGGPADYFALCQEIGEVEIAIKFAQEKDLPILILGGGSNILFSDQGFRGLVIKLDLQKLEFHGQEVTVGAGVLLAFLLNQTLEHGLIGLEFAAGVPGTLGGAIRGNAGTYGLAMSDVIKEVSYFDENYQLKYCLGAECNFAYRHSIFKENKNIIVEAKLLLKTGDVVAARQLVADRLKYRQDTQPNEPSAGCIFKNIEFKNVDIEDLERRGLDLTPFVKNQKIPASYLIDRAGLKGHIIGGVKVSEKHANYIVNFEQKGTAEQVIMLVSFIKQQVRDKYGVQLQEEVQFVV